MLLELSRFLPHTGVDWKVYHVPGLKRSNFERMCLDMLWTHLSLSIHQRPTSIELLSLELVKFKFSVSFLRILRYLINITFRCQQTHSCTIMLFTPN